MISSQLGTRRRSCFFLRGRVSGTATSCSIGISRSASSVSRSTSERLGLVVGQGQLLLHDAAVAGFLDRRHRGVVLALGHLLGGDDLVVGSPRPRRTLLGRGCGRGGLLAQRVGDRHVAGVGDRDVADEVVGELVGRQDVAALRVEQEGGGLVGIGGGDDDGPAAVLATPRVPVDVVGRGAAGRDVLVDEDVPAARRRRRRACGGSASCGPARTCTRARRARAWRSR